MSSNVLKYPQMSPNVLDVLDIISQNKHKHGVDHNMSWTCPGHVQCSVLFNIFWTNLNRTSATKNTTVVPRQRRGTDHCGVFICLYASLLLKGVKQIKQGLVCGLKNNLSYISTMDTYWIFFAELLLTILPSTCHFPRVL